MRSAMPLFGGAFIRSVRRRLMLLCVAACVPVFAHSQERAEPRVGRLTPAVTAAVIEAWNAPATQTVRGRFTVAPTDTINATLAVLNGPLIVSGTVRGDLVLINGDMRLDSTAVITGSVVVVGGSVTGRTNGRIDGEMAVWRSRLAYTERDGQLEADEDITMFSRYATWRERAGGDLRDVLVTSAHTYNRVEGLAILAGPRLRFNRGTSRATFEALGIFRTGDRIAWERENLGHRLLIEVREGSDDQHVAIGARHMDEINPVESWALKDTETGLTSVLFARDYRDYWNRFGGQVFLRVVPQRALQLTATIGREQWASREARNPWALFRGGRTWRTNPGALEGTATLAGLNAHIDTRNDPERPRDGWLVRADFEHGKVDVTQSATPDELSLTAPELQYGRGFVDVRRYNRIAPLTSVNLRLVAGGLLYGDALPAQRRLSVSGVDALPGYGFRSLTGTDDVGMCNTLSPQRYAELGAPAQCDRIMLLQAELKGDFRIALFGAERRTDDRRWYADGLRADGSWVVFANSGRGWLVGARDSALTYGRRSLPSLGSFRSDVGVGLDFGALGVYVAQPLQGGSSTPRVFLRIGARF